ncbi:single-stranded-DNA-specific exonuclease RecJ [Candidatus Uhrbacteria bacterium RIFCSPHIGHO2_02_FULL_47_44]|uniref:Single-stranded-DNA-specific exonuclease RecJ n=1 Tax=Candidatus Uhrbacteria bacterium RIFCSPLOWO2_02_FULL_48_18 TaxID=1802408 RepID=A0A1F7V974_9BACT|nr:MAG: single-stranded-DNA-specific exonuclease RecJ [Candidatus Uhrbacteria bacterium RIFCSPHIGHO2_02_FULL_47_44]OGL76166.1 MAG: single-stranded-DNA-specific exonuclease RecJ [Candidatus Uhrbacteria bacterium RIFCSPHIGHO2_12_FULL_47_12]OGL81913.1 MAG: single-stranded-DNA-specific exonuclease RecJ [Candidatus Uhrbacteria bacterium RIFCSPLOWO2_01_FULL_47_17]OGL87076.1 MAG: single-stranded-DNA-specific exonuclease RecJ [Candidatus Uhrbacteria bacterium RIFCSPLOWO2_02_FULL_48_18]
MSKLWLAADPAPAEFFAQFPELHPVLLQLLYHRGIKTQEQIDIFLGPDWSRDTCAPSTFRNMSVAVSCVFDAFSKGEVITIHGDYDADGVCGSTVLVTTLRDISRALKFDESKIEYYIPHRELEGYGFSTDTVEQLREKTKLVITVDCGISNKPAIDLAKSYGIDTIVCDHHTMPKELPESAILIHPLVPGETFSNKHLCGTGVAFKLASALIDEARVRGADFPIGHEKWLLDLVAIATVTDMVPLVGENRVLEIFGLLVLNKTKRPGLRALIEIAGGKLGELDTTSIGFQIGPRLNAAGRMAHAYDALELMIEEDETKAVEKAMKLQATNKARQARSDEMYKEAKSQLVVPPEGCIILYQDGWQAGLVGLVAGKLVNEYGLPTFIFGKEGNHYIGSGRSTDRVDLMPALHAAAAHLEKYGGHPQACGLSIRSCEDYEAATKIMRETLAASMAVGDGFALLPIDADMKLEDVSWDLVSSLEKCKPFGMGNPSPIFAARSVTVVGLSTVGADGKHLRLTIQSPNGKILKMIGFSFGFHIETLHLGDVLDVAFEVTINEWNGNRELQGRIIDLRKSVVHTIFGK